MRVSGSGVSGTGETVHGSFGGSGDVTEDGAGNSGCKKMMRWLVFVAAVGGSLRCILLFFSGGAVSVKAGGPGGILGMGNLDGAYDGF